MGSLLVASSAPVVSLPVASAVSPSVPVVSAPPVSVPEVASWPSVAAASPSPAVEVEVSLPEVWSVASAVASAVCLFLLKKKFSQ